MTTLNMQDAKTNLSKLVSQALAGEEVIIANRGKPAVRLVPVERPTKRRLGFMPGPDIPDSFFEPLSEDEVQLWEG
jgi:prevent-host-death family protein